jgi:hypothetical protein
MCVVSVIFSLRLVSIDLFDWVMSEDDVDVLLCVDCLKHQQGLPQISPTILCDPLVQALDLLPTLLVSYIPEYSADLSLCGRSNSHQQRSTPDRRDNIARRVRQQDQPQIRTVLLHRPPQCRLCISCQMVCLVDDHNLEALLCAQIHLLCLCHFLEQVLHNDPVVVADI